jgi:hypothetical protein
MKVSQAGIGVRSESKKFASHKIVTDLLITIIAGNWIVIVTTRKLLLPVDLFDRISNGFYN